MTHIGDPKRIITVEPLVEPVPGPLELPDTDPPDIPLEPDRIEEPEKVPAGYVRAAHVYGGAADDGLV